MKGAVAIALALVIFASAFFIVKPTFAAAPLPTITIEADGSISPSTATIHRSGDSYTLTGDIYGALNILRSNIVLDGAGYTLRGSFNGNSTDIWVVGTGPDPTMAYYTIGVDLGGKNVEGVTVKGLNVENFSIGMYIWTKNNTIEDNSFEHCIVGLLMSGSNSTITSNYLSSNIEGLFFGFNSPSGQFPPDMVVYENAFIRNNIQISGCQCKAYNLSEAPHEWDQGKVGNYWSDYNGTDADLDGIGDTPYVIDVLDYDRYPLMQNPVTPPYHDSKSFVPTEVMVIMAFSGALATIASILVLRIRQRKRGWKFNSYKSTGSHQPSYQLVIVDSKTRICERGESMNKKFIGITVVVIVLCAIVAAFSLTSLFSNESNPAKPIDFTIQGTNSCLRFLECNVSLGYVPFTVGANQNWQLTINCTQMPGGSQGWTELYIYKGYWDNGTNYKCQAGDLYGILSNIKDDNKMIQGDSAFTQTFTAGANPQSYTAFFVFPNGGQGTFHVTYKQV